jgi:peroxiredoxin Q/BCP
VLRIGDTAPDFTAKLTSGATLTLSTLRGRFVVLYFFPRSFTPLCARETARFRDAYPDLQALGAEVIGASADDPDLVCRFAQRTRVAFPMLAEGNRAVVDLYGVAWPILRLPQRITFLIDPEGVVQGVFHHEFQVSRHLDDVLHALKKMTLARAAAR